MAASGYYARENVVRLDGTHVFQTREDRAGERAAAARMQAAWGCEVRPFGALSPIDFFAVRDDRVVGLIELKARSQASDRFKTVFLCVRKWLALTLGAAGLGVPAIFAVKFSDCMLWVPLCDIDASRMRIGGVGQARAVPSVGDREPVIEVPIPIMKPLLRE